MPAIKHPVKINSDPSIMQHTVLACMKHKIAVGRQPLLSGYARLSKMRDQNVARGLTAAIRYQVGVLKACLDAEGIALHHRYCRAVYAAVPKGTTGFGLARTIQKEVAKEMELLFTTELYCDV
ncbi:hypothetical protein K469DRAFT_733555 [Zopfia rhizophila CBS 207.26]|uniref:Uncharacterized protein n=1 Tax=Zopfia rhizophila CBS 207.26 TaxID=1314779 RepID=A0A6A6DCI4_9PEZI|nr:hypothetical protein K469DRAFT_733555 [Zopfia rhizophila CBS 207.26]